MNRSAMITSRRSYGITATSTMREIALIVSAFVMMMSSSPSSSRFGLERGLGVSGVSMNYYTMSCPMAEFVVKNTVNRALGADPTLAAGLIRMHFHDCFVEGCDASVLIDSTDKNTAEKDSPANLSLRGYEVIDDAKRQLERQCPGVVSCADIVAMASRDAVFFAGGPVYGLAMGRKDGRRSKIEDTFNLPPPTLNASQLIAKFSSLGFTAQEMVALSGAHTLGVARCSSFADRIDNANKNDPLEASFIKKLTKTCAGDDGLMTEQPFDDSRNGFDSDYFGAVMQRNGLLSSDHALYTSPKTRPVAAAYAQNQAMFFFDFQKAMRKMSLLSLKDGGAGEVRSNCRAFN